MIKTDNRLGIILMSLTSLIFALQDGISRHLASEYNVFVVVMFRYWFFAGFVLILAHRSGGITRALQSERRWLQILRGLLLALEICVTVGAIALLGLTETHAIFVCYPLFIVALSGPFLGERVGWRRWLAIAAGFCGVLIILQPGSGVFSPLSAIPLLGAMMFAAYGLLTRYAARFDSSATSYFYTGVVGAVVMTVIGLLNWEPMVGTDWIWLLMLCSMTLLGHWLLIKTYEFGEASAVQPFAYLQLPFAAMVGITVFSETLRLNVGLGAAIIVLAGLFTLWRAEQSKP
ncbi:DMT family transporter [Cognatishimia sp. SS12]|uniref:DMT family transporter n=1 Tax=Cognatishimia sp. SS12 TaxID=2979465 RepID=UPI00232CEEFB|nr:DMT family transporter [Cognatishimia sp. SS12]MDC0738004.1 DMT family transporter [Cognatishimia sp. SS12]